MPESGALSDEKMAIFNSVCMMHFGTTWFLGMQHLLTKKWINWQQPLAGNVTPD